MAPSRCTFTASALPCVWDNEKPHEKAVLYSRKTRLDVEGKLGAGNEGKCFVQVAGARNISVFDAAKMFQVLPRSMPERLFTDAGDLKTEIVLITFIQILAVQNSSLTYLSHEKSFDCCNGFGNLFRLVIKVELCTVRPVQRFFIMRNIFIKLFCIGR